MGEGAAFARARDAGTAPSRAAPRIYGEVARLRPQRRRVPHHRAVARRRRARPRACSSRSTTPGSTPSDIGHVNAHGTSTPLNDAAEAEAIRKVFGDTPPPVTSTKGVTGHLIARRRRGRGGDQPACSLARRRRPADREPRADRRRHRPRRRRAAQPRPSRRAPVLSNSFGFGGHNATLILAPASTVDDRVDRRADARLRAPTAPRRSPSVARDRRPARSCWFRLDGGKHRGAIGTPEGDDRRAGGPPRRSSSGSRSSAARHLGRRRSAKASPRCTRGAASPRRSSTLSGVVPTCSLSTGRRCSGPALAARPRRPRVMTDDAFAYVTGPDVGRRRSPACRRRATGSAARAVHDRRERRRVAGRRRRGRRAATRSRRSCSLPARRTTSTIPPFEDDDDPVDRPCDAPRPRVPARADRVVRRARRHRRRARRATRFLELRAALRAEHRHRPRPARRPRRRRRRQPADAPGRHARHRGVAQKAARFVQWCDCFNLPIITFVDTPRLRAGPRPRVARHDPPRRRAACTRTRRPPCRASASCCARRTAARTS